MSALDVEVGDMVVYAGKEWLVTDSYERSPLRQRQVSLFHPAPLRETRTGVPYFEVRIIRKGQP